MRVYVQRRVQMLDRPRVAGIWALITASATLVERFVNSYKVMVVYVSMAF